MLWKNRNQGVVKAALSNWHRQNMMPHLHRLIKLPRDLIKNDQQIRYCLKAKFVKIAATAFMLLVSF
jgi:hypothetical protein